MIAKIGMLVALLTFSAGHQDAQAPEDRLAYLCFGAGEQVSGRYKICYYKCLSGTVAITIPALQFCPLTIDR